MVVLLSSERPRPDSRDLVPTTTVRMIVDARHAMAMVMVVVMVTTMMMMMANGAVQTFGGYTYFALCIDVSERVM